MYMFMYISKTVQEIAIMLYLFSNPQPIFVLSSKVIC